MGFPYGAPGTRDMPIVEKIHGSLPDTHREELAFAHNVACREQAALSVEFAVAVSDRM